MRCEIGWPTSETTPGICARFWRTSSITAVCGRSRGLSHDFDLAHVHACSMLVQFGASGSARRGNNFRRSMQGFLHRPANPVGFCERRPGRERDVDVQCAFIEGGRNSRPISGNTISAMTSRATEVLMI